MLVPSNFFCSSVVIKHDLLLSDVKKDAVSIYHCWPRAVSKQFLHSNAIYRHANIVTLHGFIVSATHPKRDENSHAVVIPALSDREI